MEGMFVTAQDAVREQLDWGSMAWCSRPATTGTKDLVAIEVTLTDGGGHAFHKHPKQEEMIYVIEGQVEQWLGREKRMLGPGDSVYLPAGTVHASFCEPGKTARLLAVLAPCVGDGNGYEVEEVADQPEWQGLR
jgi:quercetin dioxygenase-like cupin family protein